MKQTMVVEVGIKLNKDLKFYQKILKQRKAVLKFLCETRDIYWTNGDFQNKTENEIKKSCVRLRLSRKLKKILCFMKKSNWSASFDNFAIFDKNTNNKFKIDLNQIKEYESKFESKGWRKVFDTTKIDYQYSIGEMKSRIQLQQIENVGLLLYYDNPDYYDLPEEEQRIALIKELNSYGFDIGIEVLGLDKLKTLYYKKEMFSKNQNG